MFVLSLQHNKMLPYERWYISYYICSVSDLCIQLNIQIVSLISQSANTLSA